MRADALLAKFLQTQRDQRLLIATRDDLAAVYAKNAIEMNRRQSDCIFVSQRLDPIIHGGASEKKEIDPDNRGSVVRGSVAYYMDPLRLRCSAARLRLLAGPPPHDRGRTGRPSPNSQMRPDEIIAPGGRDRQSRA